MLDYGDTSLRSIIEGDRHYRNDENESFGEYGFSKQEFEDGELVDVEDYGVDEAADGRFAGYLIRDCSRHVRDGRQMPGI